MIANMKQILLEEFLTTKNARGDNIETLGSSYNIWAEVKRLSGSRVDDQKKQIGLTNVFQFRLWFNDNISLTGNYRITYDNRVFTVQAIEKENENNFYWIIQAEALDER